MLAETNTATVLRYVVRIDDHNLGSFSSCVGLGAGVVLKTRQEGGNNQFVWQLPTRITYPTIKLTRPLGADTSKVATWFSGIAQGYTRHTGTIQAMTADGTVIAEWGLEGVVPVRWSGPSFTPDSPQVAAETIEIDHHGFISSNAG